LPVTLSPPPATLPDRQGREFAMTEKPSYEELERRIQALEKAQSRRLPEDVVVRSFFNFSLDMLCVAGFDGYLRMINPAVENTLGYSRQVLLDTPFIEFVHPDDKTATLRAIEQLATGEPVVHFEIRCRCKDGSYKWYAWSAVPIVEEGFAYAIGRDVTEQKVIQRELAAQRDLFDSVLSNVHASIFWKDRNSVYLGGNERFIHEAGLQSLDELVGKTDYDLAWTREQADFYRECDRKVMEAREPMLNIEESQQQADGGRVELLTNKVPLVDASGQVTGMLGVYLNISKRKHAEATLRKSEARLQTLFDSAPELIFVIDPEGSIIKANRYVYAHTGYNEKEVIGKNIRQFFTDASRSTCDCNFPILRERGYSRADTEFVCKDGRVIEMECSATAVPDEDGKFTTFLIIQRDVTERNRAVAALANSERRFRAIFNSTYQLICVLDLDGTLLQANQTALDFGGLTEADVVGLRFWDTYWWRYSTQVQSRLRAAVETASQGTPVRYEEDMLTRDHTPRTIDFTLKPVVGENGETVLIIAEGRDITDNKRAEEERQLHRQEIAHVIRLSTMGEMASGMAHELNQPLGALVSYCGTARMLIESLPTPSQQLHDILDRAVEQAHRASKIIRHLREFVGKESDHKELLSLDQLIEDINILLGSELKRAKVAVEHRLDARGCKIMANKVQIEQVLVNLIMNSVEAIQSARANGGKVILTTRMMKDKSIEVTVTDDGPGIDADIIGSMFDPFRTTKPSGMGMGLSISRSIIEAHGGTIWADTQRHSGARLGFSLPVCE
jgi:PAS domain S-box-containing protein